MPSTVTPTARRSLSLHDRDDGGERRKPLENGLRPLGRRDDDEIVGCGRPPPRVAGHLAVERVRDLLHELPRPIEMKVRSASVGSRASRSTSRRSVAGPTPRTA